VLAALRLGGLGTGAHANTVRAPADNRVAEPAAELRLGIVSCGARTKRFPTAAKPRVNSRSTARIATCAFAETGRLWETLLPAHLPVGTVGQMGHQTELLRTLCVPGDLLWTDQSRP